MAPKNHEIAEDWQILHSDAKKRGAYVLSKSLWTDCSFQFDCEKGTVILKAHKLILAMASPVFGAMFYGNLANDQNIVIEDIGPEAFKLLLMYIYTENLQQMNSVSMACELYYAAKKYRMPQAQSTCIAYIVSQLNTYNVCKVYEFADFHEEKGLLAECRQIISTRTKEILRDTTFFQCQPKTIQNIFSIDPLYINSEVDLLQALARYMCRHQRNHDDSMDTCDGSSESNRELQHLERKSLDLVDQLVKDSVSKPSKRTSPDDTASTSKSLRDFFLKDKEPKNSSKESKNSSEEPKNCSGCDCGVVVTKEDIHNILSQIRFLTLKPKEFAESLAYYRSLLDSSDILAISMNIMSRKTEEPMPNGFSLCRLPRNIGSVKDNVAKGRVTFRGIVNHVSTMKNYESEPVYIRNLPWVVVIRANYKRDVAGLPNKYLSFYIECTDKQSKWTCEIEAEIAVYAYYNAGKSICHKLKHVYKSSKSRWGPASMVPWVQLSDERHGFLDGDSIMYSVQLQLGQPVAA